MLLNVILADKININVYRHSILYSNPMSRVPRIKKQSKSFGNFLILRDAFTLARRSECYVIQILPNNVHQCFPVPEYLQVFFFKNFRARTRP